MANRYNFLDLNPIENFRHHLKKRVQDLLPTNKIELIAALKSAWNSISNDESKQLVKSIPESIRPAILAKDDATKYCLDRILFIIFILIF